MKKTGPKKKTTIFKPKTTGNFKTREEFEASILKAWKTRKWTIEEIGESHGSCQSVAQKIIKNYIQTRKNKLK